MKEPLVLIILGLIGVGGIVYSLLRSFFYLQGHDEPPQVPNVDPGASQGPDKPSETLFPEAETEEPEKENVYHLAPFDDLGIEPRGATINPNGDPSKIGIIVGINRYSPFVYQGSEMLLRGCVNDALAMRKFLIEQNYGRIYYMTDQTATINNFLLTWKEITGTVKDGDTIFIAMSRHGMSMNRDLMDKDKVKELAGINPDDKTPYSGDQAAVMFDGVIVDDCFLRLFLDLPKVKLIYWNDSCHSATQYKVALPINKPVRRAVISQPRTIGEGQVPDAPSTGGRFWEIQEKEIGLYHPVPFWVPGLGILSRCLYQ